MKKIIIALLTLALIMVIYITGFNQNTTNIEIEREAEYVGPNVDNPSLSNEEINFN